MQNTDKNMDMKTFAAVIRELEAERNQALSEKRALQTELQRLSQDMSQTKQCLELSKKEVENLKQVYQEVDYLERVVHQKDEERSEMMSHINFLSEEKAAMEVLLNTRRSDLSEAENEIFHLRHLLQEREFATNMLEEKLQGMKQCEAQKQQLTDQLTECKMALQLCKMHEDTLRHQLSNAEKLQVEIGERNRMVSHLQDALQKEKRTVDELMEVLHGMQRDMDTACLALEKSQAEVETLQQKTHALASELSAKQEENDAIRRNVEDIRKEILAIKKENLNEELRAHNASGGDQNAKITCGLLQTRRNLGTVAKASESHARQPYTARSKLLSSLLSSAQHKESVQPADDPMKIATESPPPPLAHCKDRQFRRDRLTRRFSTRRNEVMSSVLKQ